jgi:hypothetical protein
MYQVNCVARLEAELEKANHKRNVYQVSSSSYYLKKVAMLEDYMQFLRSRIAELSA